MATKSPNWQKLREQLKSSWQKIISPKGKSILFVCLANICRSPLAEALLREKIKQAHFSQSIKVDSASIENWRNGDKADSRVIQLLKEHQIPYQGLKSRLLKPMDAKRFDLIICMDTTIYDATRERLGESYFSKIVPFSHFLEDQADVDDPMLTKDFQTTYQQIDRGTDKIIHYLQNNIMNQSANDSKMQ
ncbi:MULTISPECIES: low molecular weight protein-tyrosine-phosphatase [Aerococcus]|uniref:low molecular weight protein-tyrosine-phosphatase n=1 Tax=Aerococcus TaxID=1375 RepID=UPI000200E76D|nr:MULTISPECIES: low molecular weight protein-tyrosine-phosphatase [Aerococcus]AEA01248.1 low molecular weight phosphotyrosine protein phosphatase [Aerococcus sp. Group 1]MCY3030961.1 low molecular weight phosphotyrosine protein phosphatase [Aerococcus sp. Group 1]MCY3055410.1 low molecular weight phosphotyrosine protein phosphatase [Aerococcus sp. Group 1]MCY3057140.1 low molecular weight phosphotyrosine protein phosphatase [Aerococcus sp. Group 1]MCY3061407.1 low molecular weight phosphotyro